MPQFIRHPVGPVAHSTWIVPIIAGILIGCLLAFLANAVKDIRWVSHNSRTGIVPMFTDPKPAAEYRKPERYEAVRSNWQRYRSMQAKESAGGPVNSTSTR